MTDSERIAKLERQLLELISLLLGHSGIPESEGMLKLERELREKK